jgi:DNA-directed RNA polymerase subunit L
MDSKIKIIEKDKNSITFEVLNYDNTLLRPLVEELLKDEQVEESKYYIKHPVIDNPRIYVKVKSGKPQAAVKRSIARLSKIFDGLSSDLSKEFKRIEESEKKSK